MRKELNISNSTFYQIIESNFMYVDKTEYVYKMVRQAKGQYFLSRPRRFGKSMLLSTLKSYFEGNKEVFKEQYLYNQDLDWKSYPIIHLSMNKIKADTADNYERNLSNAVDIVSSQYQIKLLQTDSALKFEELILALSKDNKQVVILIDEYDKPILDNVNNMVECKKIRKTLKSFYGQIKAYEEKLRFTFITGVSKFSQVSMFSDMNNLDDITMNAKFAGICGFTQEECESYFAEWIAENAETLDMTKAAYLAKLKEYYDGIRFTDRELYLYNPVSFTKSMKDCKFKNYWFETGSPSFLLDLIKKDLGKEELKELKALDELEEIEVESEVFSVYEIDNLGIIALLYQTGYLTIKDYDVEDDLYTLGYPNREVKKSFVKRLANTFAKAADSQVSRIFSVIYKSLLNNKMEDFFEALKTYYASIDYDIKEKNEKCYQLIFYLVFVNLNFRVKTEVKTNNARMDAVVKTPNYIYIIEFKVDQSADVAIEQIKDREYYQKYLLEEKKVVLIGVNFDTKSGQINDYKYINWN